MRLFDRAELGAVRALELAAARAVTVVDELREVVHADRAAALGDRADHRVGHVARVVGERARRAVRGERGPLADLEDVPERLVADVGDVDDHTQSVHLRDHAATEGREAELTVIVAGAVTEDVVVRPRERHVAHA